MDNLRFSLLSVLTLMFHCQFAMISSDCTQCYSSVCPESNCLEECTSECRGKFYQIQPDTTFMCAPATTSASPTTTTTTTTTTTVATATTGTREISANTLHTNSTAGNTTVHRKRRQANETVMTETPQPPPTIETATTAAATTPTIMPTSTKVVCRLCSVENCNTCKDDAVNNTICESCLDGFHLSNYAKSCSKNSDELSGGAIAGIVIGVLCFVAIVVIIVIFLVRRFSIRDGDQLTNMTQPSDNSGHRNHNISSPLPKINTEDMQRQHDRITRYAKDPTIKKSPQTKKKNRERDNEQDEISGLGEPPPPPHGDLNHRYDKLSDKNQDDRHSYVDLKDSSEYVNIHMTEQAHHNAEYKNINQVGYSGSQHGQNETDSDSLQEMYEPVNTIESNEKAQKLYVNNESASRAQNNHNDNKENQEVYVNQGLTEEVYENT